jgi:hypothetical protein
MRTLPSALLLLPTLLACKAPDVPPTLEKARPSEQPAEEADPGQTLAAAGVAITLPSTWTIVDERDADFALALGPGDNPPTCTIELRRQGLGDLPKGTRERDVGEFDFTRGVLRGRVRALPGPTEGTTVLVECLAPRAAQWAAIEATFDSQKSAPLERTTSSSPPPPRPIAQLCTGTPAHPTYVCVRKHDGAVYCGPSDGDVLARVGGIEPSSHIACDGARACSRAAETGALQCWKADTEPKTAAEITAPVRDLAGGCVVDAAGKVWCRERETNGLTTETFTELMPFGDPAFALDGIQHVLAGSSTSQGCVLGPSGLQCWDRATTLQLPLPDNQRPHTLEVPAPAVDLAAIGGRVCVGGPERWTCIDGDRRFSLEDCDRRACGCSLLGAMQLSCEHEPSEHGVLLLGRIADVTAVDGACAALADGTVLCRGQATSGGDSPRVRELVAGVRVGAVHVLELREPSTPSNNDEAESN